MDYFGIECCGDLNDSTLGFLDKLAPGLDGAYRASLGVRATKHVPPQSTLTVRGNRLAGFVGNTSGFLLVSTAAKNVIAAMCPKKTEYLPVTIVGAKHKPIGEGLSWIVNPLGGLDVLDESASEITRASDGRFLALTRPVLDPKKLACAPHLFRLAQKTPHYVLSDALVGALLDAGIGNLFLRPLSLSAPARGPSATREGLRDDFLVVDPRGDQKNKKLLVIERRGEDDPDRLLVSTATRGDELPDVIGNDLGELVVSQKARRVLEEAGSVASRPVTIVGRKGALVDGYSILAPGSHDAYHPASGMLFQQTSDGLITSSVQVVLEQRKLVGAPALFRLTHRAGAFVMCKALANVLHLAGVTNLVARPAKCL